MSFDDRILNMLEGSTEQSPLSTHTLARGSTIGMTLRSLDRLHREGKIGHCKKMREGKVMDGWWRTDMPKKERIDSGFKSPDAVQSLFENLRTAHLKRIQHKDTSNERR